MHPYQTSCRINARAHLVTYGKGFSAAGFVSHLDEIKYRRTDIP